MPNPQRPRREEPFFQLAATGEDFEKALRFAVPANVNSMNALRHAIGTCMKSLKADGMECEAALLTMKAFMRELGLKQRRSGSVDLLYSQHLTDQIIRWCISDFYIDA